MTVEVGSEGDCGDATGGVALHPLGGGAARADGAHIQEGGLGNVQYLARGGEGVAHRLHIGDDIDHMRWIAEVVIIEGGHAIANAAQVLRVGQFGSHVHGASIRISHAGVVVSQILRQGCHAERAVGNGKGKVLRDE